MLLALSLPVTTLAINSSNYQIKEDFVGGSGGQGSNSASYRAEQALGDSAAGQAASTNYQTHSGTPTTDEPTLTFIVNSSSVNLGSLSTSLTRTGTATFSVLNYTSYGYVVQTIGNPPSNGVHTLSGMSTTAGSAIGTEQFGINLKANTSPTTFGSDPIQSPDANFSFGAAASGYNTANQFTYVSGNTIASAPKSSGRTDYTISYIANIAPGTQGGSYSGDQTLICTGSY